MKTLDILINGASIAGPACAILLAEQGHRVTVVERASALREGGQTVDLRGVGLDIIERMGLLPAVEGRLLDQRGIAWVDERGRRRAEMPVEAFGGRGIISSHEILRGDLAEVLYQASLPATTYRWANTITALDQQAGRVVAHFAHGPAEAFDLVIGADGVGSTTRGLAFDPAEVRLESLGLLTAWFTASLSTDLAGWYLMLTVPDLVASVRPSRTAGEVKVALSVHDPALHVDTGDRAACRRLIADRFDGVGWLVPELLAELDRADDVAFQQVGAVQMQRWTSDRVALVGDSGYCPTPLTGRGTTLALAGAWTLAAELARTGGDVPQALAGYDAAMRPNVTSAQKLPPGGAKGYSPRSRLGVALGHWSMRSMNRWPMRAILEREFSKPDEIRVPDGELRPRQHSDRR